MEKEIFFQVSKIKLKGNDLEMNIWYKVQISAAIKEVKINILHLVFIVIVNFKRFDNIASKDVLKINFQILVDLNN